MFDTSCNLVAIWWKTEIKIAEVYICNKSCIESGTKIASKIACVTGP